MRLLMAAIVLTLVACGRGEAQPPAHDTQPPGPSTAAVRIVAENYADLHLWVSNQSFDEPSVVVTVTIDGVEIISRRFDVEGQHNWKLFPIAAPPGPHVIEARSDTGATMRQQVTLPERERRYAVIDYWTDPHRHFEWRLESTPIGFD